MCSRRQTNDDLAGRRETNFYNITTLPILLDHHSLPKEMFAGKKPPQEMANFKRFESASPQPPEGNPTNKHPPQSVRPCELNRYFYQFSEIGRYLLNIKFKEFLARYPCRLPDSRSHIDVIRNPCSSIQMVLIESL